jgi:TPR repeat protein
MLLAALLSPLQIRAEGQIKYEKMTMEQLSAASENGDVDAIFEQGYRHLRGEGVDFSSQKAWEYFDKALATKKASAIYLYGHVVRQNPANRFGYKHEEVAKKAAGYFRRAAEMGHGPAMYQMGYIYECFDEGVGNDDKKAKFWYQKAATAGVEGAALKLIDIELQAVRGKDSKKELELLQKGAALGGKNHALDLARIYLTGEGVPQNYAEAVKLLQPLAEKGDGWACWYYSKCLENGYGTNKDGSLAITYLENAAEKEIPEAMLRFSHMLFEGKSVKKDAIRAYITAVKMSRIGYRDDPFGQDPFEKKLTKEEKRLKEIQRKNTKLVEIIWKSFNEKEKLEAKTQLEAVENKF